jgi:ADP-ribose pyrophosphatase YjhB (NUDIX family)
MLISAAYLVGYEENKIVYLDVRNYWFIAFPGWKGSTSELAEIIDMHQWSLSTYFWWETNIFNIRQAIREMRVWSSQKRYVAFRHRLSGIDLTGTWLPGDEEVKKVLWFDTSEVELFLRKSFPDAHPDQRLDLLLAYTPETCRETLSREYAEETGRHINSASVYAVLLEEKSPHLLKVRFCYTGNVSEKKWWRMKHTTKEQQADMRVDTIWSKKLGPLMKEKLLQKVNYKKWYAWKEAFQFKKTSTALWHYLAFLVYTALQETKTR